jgi:hypothetical protein
VICYLSLHPGGSSIPQSFAGRTYLMAKKKKGKKKKLSNENSLKNMCSQGYE